MSGAGVAGRRLYAKNASNGTRVYRCIRDPGRGQGTACGGLSVVAGPLDEEVTEQVMAALAGPGLAAALRTAVGDDEERLGLTRQLTTDEERLEQLAGDYADGLISRNEWRVARDRLAKRIASTRHRLSSNGGGRVLASLPTTEENCAPAGMTLS